MPREPSERTPRQWPYIALPALVTLAVCLWRIGTPSYWRDESVSVVVGRSSLAGIADFVGEIDAVHALYYLLVHLVTSLGDDEAITRTPSAVAAALTAAGIAVLGRRFSSTPAGVCGGLIYGLLPITSRYGQEVRQYALVGACAVLATYVLVRALEREPAPNRWHGVYVLVVGFTGWLHLYSLFLLPAHGVAVVLWKRDRGRLGHLLSWGSAAIAAVLMVMPLAVVARGQESAQVSWLGRPDADAFYHFGLRTVGDQRAVLLVLVLFAVAGAVRMFARDRNFAVLTIAWLLVPVTAAWTISQEHPVYHPRYVLYCVCALALLSGTGLAALAERAARGRTWLARAAVSIVLVVLAAAVLPAQLALRGPHSRPDDLRSFSAVLRERSRQGDAVLFVPGYRRAFVTVYADAFTRLNAAALHGPGTSDLPTGRFGAAIAAQRRVWVVESPPPRRRYRTSVPKRNLAALREDSRFAPAGTWLFGSVRLTLYTRSPEPERTPRAGGNERAASSRG